MSIALDYNILRREICVTIMGYDRDPDTLSDDQAQDVDDSIRAGYWDFLYPESGHEWGFLRPVTTLVVDGSAEDYACPPEFGGVDGRKIFYDQGQGYWGTVECVSVQQLLRQRANYASTSSGPPRAYAIDNVRSTGQEPQRSQFLIWPQPDGEYTLRYTMIVVPEMLSNDKPYPWGSKEFGEALKSCVIASAALKYEHDASDRFLQDKERRMAAAVAADRRRNRGQTLGINSDNSDDYGSGQTYVRNTPVTYLGVEYNGE